MKHVGAERMWSPKTGVMSDINYGGRGRVFKNSHVTNPLTKKHEI